MDDNLFFEPSTLFREYILLKTILSNGSVSQQQLSKVAQIAPSMVNRYLSAFEQKGYIKKTGPNRKKMSYLMTQDGIFRLQYLSVCYLRQTARLYSNSRQVFTEVLDQLSSSGFRKVILYGAGIVGQTLLDVLASESVNIVAFVDDDNSKQGSVINGVIVINPSKVKEISYDAVLVASFRHADKIVQRAKSLQMKNIFVLKIQTDGRVFLQKRSDNYEGSAI
ncbi:MAG TPA: winged helix-turn-helix transcriptional regulator [Pseudothermotoga sp.]|uniref:winged helix-turn-helix transcriptional regulator n=1 Tax=Thermotoga profunda TaxID=1508420 RepID=UPI000693F9F7|nr:winged helix-turn-helix transcriptional regulator [Thermotoga profunda]